MIYGIEYFKQNDADMVFYKLPVTFTAMHDKYVATKKFEHIVKCLKNTSGIKLIRVETNETLSGVPYFEDEHKLMQAYYSCEIEGSEKGIYKVVLKQYEINPYF